MTKTWASKPSRATLIRWLKQEDRGDEASRWERKEYLSKAGERIESQAVKGGERAVRTVAPAVVGVVAKYGPTVARFAAKAGLAAAAGYAAYWVTTQLMRIKRSTVAELRYDLANKYRQSRQEFASAEGRPMNKTELAELAVWYKRQDEKLRSYGPDNKIVNDLTHLRFGD